MLAISSPNRGGSFATLIFDNSEFRAEYLYEVGIPIYLVTHTLER